MATFLYRLGRFSFRQRWLVAALWVAMVAVAGLGAATLSGSTSNSFSIPGTEAQQAIDLLNKQFPQASAGGATARVVFVAPKGQSLADPASKAAVEQVVTKLKAAPQVASVADPYAVKAVNPAGTIGYASVTYQVQANQLTDPARTALLDSAAPGRAAGLTVEIGGDAVQAAPATGATEIIGVAVAAVVLVITFGSLIAAGLPLLTAIVGIGIGIASITALTGFVDLNANTPTLALMLGLAVAIDYALFIVSRYRNELTLGRAPEEAAGRAVGTAGSAVVFAGLTVIIALAGLSVVNIPFLTQMGLAAAGTVAISVLIALTLLPALLGFAGRRIMGRRSRRRTSFRGGGPESPDSPVNGGHATHKVTVGRRWSGFVTRHPVPVLLVAVLGLGAVAIPALDLRLGLPDDGTAAPDTTQRKAYDLLTEGFGAGFNGPLTIVVDAAHSSDPKAAAAQTSAAIGKLADVTAVTPVTFNQAGNTAVLSVIPRSGPNDQATKDLVTAIRDQAGAIRTSTGADVMVTGQTAINNDISSKLGAALLPYLALIVGLAFVLLALVFRSILVPLKATLGFLLSMAAAFGAVVAVFQWGWLSGLLGVQSTGPIISLLPIFLIGIIFGLAMDYEVFLVTRMREEYVHGAEPTTAVVTGFEHGARVVTAAAIIMISVFSGFILSPESLVKTIGFGLAAAVALDAFVVRMTIVPAVMALLGRAAWWLPNWLNRILPNVDVEGEKLRHRLDGQIEDPTGAAAEPELASSRT